MLAEFSNGDPPVSLTSFKGGRWDGTWQGTRNQSSVSVTVKAVSGGLSGAKTVSGGFGANQQRPVVADSGVVDAATGIAFRPLAPGSLITINGELLAVQSVASPVVPLGQSLGDTFVQLGAQVLPLAEVSPQQIKAVIPYGLEVKTSQSLIVGRGDQLSQPVPVTLAETSPAIFTKDGTQGYVVNATGALVAPGNAAKAGDVVTIYSTGLGSLVENADPADYGPASTTVRKPVSVSIGGQTAEVRFSGLAPGLVGLYWVQTAVPAGIAAGDAVPVILSSQRTPIATSPTVTIAVQ